MTPVQHGFDAHSSVLCRCNTACAGPWCSCPGRRDDVGHVDLEDAADLLELVEVEAGPLALEPPGQRRPGMLASLATAHTLDRSEIACSTRVAILTRSSSAGVGSVVVVIGSPPPEPRPGSARPRSAAGGQGSRPHPAGASRRHSRPCPGRRSARPDVLDRVNRHVLGLSCPVVEQAGASRLSGTRRSRPWHHWSSTNAAPGWPSPSTHQGCR